MADRFAMSGLGPDRQRGGCGERRWRDVVVLLSCPSPHARPFGRETREDSAMRLPVTCWGCVDEFLWNLRNLPRENLQGKWVEPECGLLELRDDGAYLWTCPRGHTDSFALQNLRHEVLYEAGGVALLCGFHREAISSMATALERFYEFVIFVLTEHRGINPDDVSFTWKEVSRQSERQLGAFYFLYLTTFGRPFTQPPQARKMTEFRNDVVHKGRIPTRVEAQSFAEYVFTIVRGISKELDEMDASAIERVRGRLIAPHSEKLEKRRMDELPDTKRKGVDRRYGMMLRSWWEHPGMADDFDWCLEALAYRIKKSGAGILAEDRPFTRFHPVYPDEINFDPEDT